MTSNTKIEVSACLIGEHVRYDGVHKLDRYITDVLGTYFSSIPVCPEVSCNLPTPLESMHKTEVNLCRVDAPQPRLITHSNRDAPDVPSVKSVRTRNPA